MRIPKLLNTVLTLGVFSILGLNVAHSQIVDLSEKSLTGRPLYKGQIIDLKTKEPLPAAQINVIVKKGDSTSVNMYVADREANFRFNAPRKNARIEVICVGYKVFEMLLPDEQKNEIDLGKIRLEPDVQKADEAVVKGRIALYQMKGDTTLIFPAAIKTMTGDALIDLLRRHPLFKVDEMGNVFFNGQRIERVDVNGKLLFGEDAVTAVKTLTASDVHLLKSYEETDEIDEILRGTENARKRRILSVITFKNFASIKSGDILVEGGRDRNEDIDGEKRNRYAAIGNLGMYNDTMRLSLTASLDNRPSVKVSPFFGLTYPTSYSRTSRFGGRYERSTSRLLDQLALTYYYGTSYGKSRSKESSEYLISPQTSESASSSVDEGNSHQLGLSFRKTKERQSSVMLQYFGTIKNNDIFTQTSRETFIDGASSNRFNQIHTNDQQTHEHKLMIDLVKSLNFAKKRGIQIGIEGRYYNNEGMAVREDTTFAMGNPDVKIMSVSRDAPNLSLSAKTNVVLGGNFSTNLTFRYDNNKRYNFAVNERTMEVDTTMSTDVKQHKYQLESDWAYRFFVSDVQVDMNARVYLQQYDYKDLFANEKIDNLDLWVLPGISISYYRNPKMRISLSARGFKQSLNPMYLSSVLDVRNPMSLRAGNPNLKPMSEYQLGASVDITGGLRLAFSDRVISGSPVDYIRYFEKNTILPEYGNYEALAGSTLNTYASGRTHHDMYVTAGWSKYTNPMVIGLEAKYRYSNRDGMLNNESYRNYTNEYSMGIRLQSNFSTDVRIDVNNTTSYLTEDDISPETKESFRNQFMATMKWYFLDRFEFDAEYINDTYRRNLSDNDINNNLLNLKLACRVFKNRQGVITFNAYDVLNCISTTDVRYSPISVHTRFLPNYSSFYTLSFSYRFSRF